MLPYLAQWLERERGLDGAAIGAVLSIAQIARLATGPIIALWAERAKDHGAALRWLALSAIGANLYFFFFAKDFWTLLVGAICGSDFDARGGAVRRSRLDARNAEGANSLWHRTWLGVVGFYLRQYRRRLVDRAVRPGAVAIWVMSTLSIYALSAWLGLKPDPAPVHHADAPPASHAIKLLFQKKRFWLLIAATRLIQSSHAFYYGFSNLTWIGQGIAPSGGGRSVGRGGRVRGRCFCLRCLYLKDA